MNSHSNSNYTLGCPLFISSQISQISTDTKLCHVHGTRSDRQQSLEASFCVFLLNLLLKNICFLKVFKRTNHEEYFLTQEALKKQETQGNF
jgi:hypothetical protein